MVDEERGINGNGVLTEETNPESMIVCETQVANGANSRVCETQMTNGDANSRECETQVANGDANSRECETQVANGDANSRECETQVTNGDANLRECVTQVANGDANGNANLRECETQVTNGDANLRECATQVANGDANMRECVTQVANGDANMRESDTQVANGDVNLRESDTQVANVDANLRESDAQVANGNANLSECETQVANGDANSSDCETQVANGDANMRESETQVANGDANLRESDTQVANGDANSIECETQVTNGNSRESKTQVTNGDANSRESEIQVINGDANSRESEIQVTNGDANSRECETQVTNGDANVRVCETLVANSDANLREREIQMANGECETQMTNSAANSRDGLRMYKRRKCLKGCAESKMLEDGKGCLDSASQVSDKTTKEPVDKVFDNASSNQALPRRESNSFMNWLGDSLLRRSRDLVLEKMFQSLCESEGGLGECIQNARIYHPDNGSPSTIKDRHCFGEERQLFPSGLVGNGPFNASNHQSNTELCKNVFFNILVSDKFTELCNLLFRSFRGGKIERVLDVSIINSRMKEGAYEGSPMLFHSDIQQVWTTLQNVGNEMVALGKSLSDNTMTYIKKVGASVCTTSEDGKDKHFLQDTEMLADPKQRETCCTYRVCTCRKCGEKADGGNFLVCDSCEEIYHVACINPPVEQVPLASWYCSNCVAKGAEKPHKDCALCERLNSVPSPFDGILVSEDELEEEGGGQKRWARCNICKNEVKTSQKYRTCGHLHCPNKYYHDNCLTSKQLGIYASCWYCPCCLCRSCLTDKDDDKIVMCDGCDQAYHIYCMQPPCESIPEGKWFCTKCDDGIERIRRAKRAYENRQRELKGKGLQGEGQHGNLEPDKSGGVDMLLTAAKTLNYQESMEELRKKR